MENEELNLEQVEYLINCDANPFMPKGWKVESHQKGGQLAFDPTKVELYLSPNQQGEKHIVGNKLRKELVNKCVLNANVLDYLLVHPELIPEDWKKNEQGEIRYIFFWGTIYRVSRGSLYVRCLYFCDDKWSWHFHWLDYEWLGNHPAALRAN